MTQPTDIAIRMNPSVEETILKRADALLSLRRYDEAIQEVKKVFVITPEHSAGLNIQGKCLIYAEKYDEALIIAQKLLAANPGSAYAHFMYGFIQAKLRNLAQAEASFRNALQRSTNYPDCYGHLALIFYSQDRFAEALSVARTGLSFDPQHIECLKALALTFSKQNEKAQVLQTTRYLLQRGIEDSNVFYHVGLAFSNIGKFSEAQEYFQEALRLDPQNDYARTKLRDCIAGTFPVYQTLLKIGRKLTYYTSTNFQVKVKLKQTIADLFVHYGINTQVAKLILFLPMLGLLGIAVILAMPFFFFLLFYVVLLGISAAIAYLHIYIYHKSLFTAEDIHSILSNAKAICLIIFILILLSWINVHTH